MITATALPDLLAIEKQREQEIEEARVIQWAMLPSETFRTDSGWFPTNFGRSPK